MYKALWTTVVLAAVALGIACFSGIVNHSEAQADSTKVSAVAHQESVDRTEIARLQAEVHALSSTRSSTP
jgi:hypothetical protein